MEIFKEDKFSKWKHILKKLHNTKTVDPKRLDSIETKLEKDQTPYSSDINYLEEKYQQMKDSETKANQTSQKDEKKPNFEHELHLIEQLHEKKIGDFSRLESIRNYLMDGQALLQEDSFLLQQENGDRILL